MTRFALAGVAGLAAAFALTVSPSSRADDPPATVTVVTTATVEGTYAGLPASRWAARSRTWHRRYVQADRDRRAGGRVIRGLRRAQRARWTPTVDYALELASRVYGVPLSSLRAVAYCESRFDVYARNGQYRGLFQEGPMFERGPFAGFGVYDPLANSLTAARVMAREGFGQWQCKP